jgi:hypothetical protein
MLASHPNHTYQLNEWFDELLSAMQQRSVFVNRGDDPVYFLVYPPRWSLQVYELWTDWKAKLQHRNWTPVLFNLGEALLDYLRDHPDRNQFVEYEKRHPKDVALVNESVSALLMVGRDHFILEDWVRDKIQETVEHDRGVLVLSGIELLHPYLQIGRIEQRLQGKFLAPTVVLYPGFKTSTFGLKYLGIYPPDGNYRSRHIGGLRG